MANKFAHDAQSVIDDNVSLNSGGSSSIHISDVLKSEQLTDDEMDRRSNGRHKDKPHSSFRSASSKQAAA